MEGQEHYLEVEDQTSTRYFYFILFFRFFFYACETWTLTAELHRRIQALEMRLCRNILGISYKDHVTNEKVRVTIKCHIGPHEDLLTTVKNRKQLVLPSL